MSAMQPTLQEIATAAIRDIDARRAAKRIRRVGRPVPGGRLPVKRKTVRIVLPLAVAFEGWERDVIRNRVPLAAPAPHKRYLMFFVTGFVLIVASSFGLAWARESAGWRGEERARRQGAIFQQAAAARGEMAALTRQAERLEEKARILLQYSSDLRYSLNGYDGSLQIRQADAVLADRDRLLAEIENRRQRLAGLHKDMAVLTER